MTKCTAHGNESCPNARCIEAATDTFEYPVIREHESGMTAPGLPTGPWLKSYVCVMCGASVGVACDAQAHDRLLKDIEEWADFTSVAAPPGKGYRFPVMLGMAPHQYPAANTCVHEDTERHPPLDGESAVQTWCARCQTYDAVETRFPRLQQPVKRCPPEHHSPWEIKPHVCCKCPRCCDCDMEQSK